MSLLYDTGKGNGCLLPCVLWCIDLFNIGGMFTLWKLRCIKSRFPFIGCRRGVTSDFVPFVLVVFDMVSPVVPIFWVLVVTLLRVNVLRPPVVVGVVQRLEPTLVPITVVVLRGGRTVDGLDKRPALPGGPPSRAVRGLVVDVTVPSDLRTHEGDTPHRLTPVLDDVDEVGGGDTVTGPVHDPVVVTITYAVLLLPVLPARLLGMADLVEVKVEVRGRQDLFGGGGFGRGISHVVGRAGTIDVVNEVRPTQNIGELKL